MRSDRGHDIATRPSSQRRNIGRARFPAWSTSPLRQVCNRALEITPDHHNDWIGQRSEAFQGLYPIGSKETKAGKADEAIFRLYSNGYKTGRDVYVYNFSRDACADNARKMVDDYLGVLRELEDRKSPDLTVDKIVSRYSLNLRWDDKLKDRVQRRTTTEFSDDYVREVAYRPFVKQHLYADQAFSQRPGLTGGIFPSHDSENWAICVPGIGSTKPFSVLVADTMPDLELISKGQCFPRYWFERRNQYQGELLDEAHGLQRVDNITDTALRTFRVHYGDNTISKDEIFEYVYGILHAPTYRERFANDLAKELPRVPFARDFRAFAEAGRTLTELHRGYETCLEYPLEVVVAYGGEPLPEHFRVTERAMRFTDNEKTALIVNDHLHLAGIPREAHEYQVNGRTPLEWFIDRYQITKDKESGIVNDPNSWFDDPRDLFEAIRRAVHLSVETVRIVSGLPEPFEETEEAGCLWLSGPV